MNMDNTLQSRYKLTTKEAKFLWLFLTAFMDPRTIECEDDLDFQLRIFYVSILKWIIEILCSSD